MTHASWTAGRPAGAATAAPLAAPATTPTDAFLRVDTRPGASAPLVAARLASPIRVDGRADEAAGKAIEPRWSFSPGMASLTGDVVFEDLSRRRVVYVTPYSPAQVLARGAVRMVTPSAAPP
jgi:hypothetical protein